MSIAEPIALNDAKKYGKTPLDRVKTLTEVIRAGGDKAQELRHVPKETIVNETKEKLPLIEKPLITPEVLKYLSKLF